MENHEVFAAEGTHFLWHMEAQLKLVNVEIIQGAILSTTGEEASSIVMSFTFLANEGRIKVTQRAETIY